MLISLAAKPIRDRGIRWKENYGKKSAGLKKKMEHALPGSYFRYEGMDYTTGHPYYCVIGPSVSKRYGKSFFAGIKKLPKHPERNKYYPPTGKYFSSLSQALQHAKKMWNIPHPQNAGNYLKQDLLPIDIPKHLK